MIHIRFSPTNWAFIATPRSRKESLYHIVALYQTDSFGSSPPVVYGVSFAHDPKATNLEFKKPLLTLAFDLKSPPNSSTKMYQVLELQCRQQLQLSIQLD